MTGTIEVGSRIRVTPVSNLLYAWANQHLVLENPQYIRKSRMGLWTGKTPKHIVLYEINGESMILPFGTLPHVAALCRGYDTVSKFAEPTVCDFGQNGVPLYDYQQIAVDAAYVSRFGILQSAAGSGKTQMGIALIGKFGRKALWITHTLDLLQQSKERAERYFDPALMGVITEGKVSIGKGITFATVQTLSKLDLSQYRDEWDVIVCDECHRISGAPTRMSQYYKVLNALSARHKYGLSATVHRADGLIQETYSLLGDICYTVPDEAVADKVMKVGIKAISTRLPVSKEYLGSDGMLNYAKLMNYICENEDRCRMVARWILTERDKSCLILSDRLSHLQAIRDLLPSDMRARSVLISGKMVSKKAKEERQQAIEDMRSGKMRYLFATYSLAKEGLDIPRLERLFLATPHKDSAVITQSVGRVARMCEGKEDAICYDFVDGDIRFLWNAWKARQRVYKHDKQYFI